MCWQTDGMLIWRAVINGLAVAAALTALSCSSADITTPTGTKYRRIDLGALPTGEFSSASDLNSAGQVVGTAEVPEEGPGITHPFLWTSGVMTDLAPPPLGGAGYQGGAAAINPAGQVVGVLRYSNSRHDFPWLWQQGVLTYLPSLENGYATDINAVGQTVGCSLSVDPTFQCHAALWQNGALTDLGTLAGGPSVAYGIDPTGRVVGQSDGHAFLWENGAMRDLNIPGGESIARRINDTGQVVGEVVVGGVTHGFLWDKGTTTDLGEVVQVSDINSRGQVVGWRTVAATDRAFIWEKGVMTDLPGPSRAFGINDKGQIVGDAGLGTPHSGFRPSRATLWTPE